MKGTYTHLDAVGGTGGKASVETVLPGRKKGAEPPARPPVLGPRWRVGRKVPINVYEGDRPVCQCHTAEDARRIVAAMNHW